MKVFKPYTLPQLFLDFLYLNWIVMLGFDSETNRQNFWFFDFDWFILLAQYYNFGILLEVLLLWIYFLKKVNRVGLIGDVLQVLVYVLLNYEFFLPNCSFNPNSMREETVWSLLKLFT